jgi:hypothetical protein
MFRIICRIHPSDITIPSCSYLFAQGGSLRLDGEVADVAGHLLDAGERRAGDLVAAEGTVEVEEDTSL